jgi:hypothetical protein
MRELHRRDFTVRDAIVLVMATAIGFALIRVSWDNFEGDFERPEEGWTAKEVLKHVPSAVEFVSPCLLPWTLAILGLRLLRPRPSLRRILLQPGFVACCAASISIAMTVGGFLFTFITETFVRALPSDLSPDDYREMLLNDLLFDLTLMWASPLRVTYAVATAWLLLALGKRCRPEPSWIDRAGRIIGILWIATYLITSWIGVLSGPVQFGHHQMTSIIVDDDTGPESLERVNREV